MHGLPLKQTLVSIPSAALMLPAPLFHQGQLYPFNPPSWSLFFELVINVWLALALFRARAGLLIPVMIASAAALIPLAGQHYHLNLGFRWSAVQIAGGTARVCFSFLCGILLYRRQGGHPRKQHWSALLLLLLTALVLLIPAEDGRAAARDLILALTVSPLLVAAAIRVEPPASLRRLFQVFGDVSYPLYAVHFPLVVIWHATFAQGSVPLGVQAIIFAAGLLALAAGLERFYDQPIRARLSRLVKLRESAPPQVIGGEG